MVGANRVMLGNGIVHVVGDPSLPANEERQLRRRLIEKALAALQKNE